MKGRQKKTHCKRGHEFTPENTRLITRIRKGNLVQERACIACVPIHYQNNKDKIIARSAQWAINNPVAVRTAKLKNATKPENKAKRRQHYLDNFEEISAYKRIKYVKERHDLSRYNITKVEYDLMWEMQRGCCAICGRNESEFDRRLSVDHCHITGAVRMLLCGNCNSGIGKFRDNPALVEKALAYLRAFEGVVFAP